MERPADTFVWPPAGTSGADAAPPAIPQSTNTLPATSALVRALVAAERYWLAPTAPPLRRRAAHAGWAPDVFDAFCNRCGRTTGPHEETEFGCAGCAEESPVWTRFVRLGEFDGDLRHWVHEVKFTRWRRLGFDLGRLLGERLVEAGLPRGALVVPMPTTARRRIARGIDHAAMLARGVAEAVDGRVVRALRRRHRPSQRAVTPGDRARNVAGAFRRTRNWDFPLETPVVLVDDVRTSGATIDAAARALRGRRQAGAPLWVGVVGVAPEPGRRRLDGT